MRVTVFVTLHTRNSFRTTLQVGILEKAGVLPKEETKEVLDIFLPLFRTHIPTGKWVSLQASLQGRPGSRPASLRQGRHGQHVAGFVSDSRMRALTRPDCSAH